MLLCCGRYCGCRYSPVVMCVGVNVGILGRVVIHTVVVIVVVGVVAIAVVVVISVLVVAVVLIMLLLIC